MYPNDPNQPQPPAQSSQPLSIDYLNQIAPQAAPRQRLKPGPKLFAITGAALVILIIIISVTVNLVVSSRRQPLEQLAARLTSTQKLTTDAKPNLKSSKLRSLNSNLELSLTNANRDIADPLLAAGVDTKKLSKSVTEKESGSAVADRLEDARLNGVFDRTYAREMAYRLSTILTLLKQINASSSSKELKAFLTTTYNNLQPTQEALAAFDETK